MFNAYTLPDTKLTSFQRQLNLYGFRRVTRGEDQGAYYHQNFRRGQKEAVSEIRRLPGKVAPADSLNDFDLDIIKYAESIRSVDECAIRSGAIIDGQTSARNVKPEIRTNMNASYPSNDSWSSTRNIPRLNENVAQLLTDRERVNSLGWPSSAYENMLMCNNWPNNSSASGPLFPANNAEKINCANRSTNGAVGTLTPYFSNSVHTQSGAQQVYTRTDSSGLICSNGGSPSSVTTLSPHSTQGSIFPIPPVVAEKNIFNPISVETDKSSNFSFRAEYAGCLGHEGGLSATALWYTSCNVQFNNNLKYTLLATPKCTTPQLDVESILNPNIQNSTSGINSFPFQRNEPLSVDTSLEAPSADTKMDMMASTNDVTDLFNLFGDDLNGDMSDYESLFGPLSSPEHLIDFN